MSDLLDAKLAKLSPAELERLKMRHSTEHVLTFAMQRVFGQDAFYMAMGPATDEGFYFDFEQRGDFAVNEEDFAKIEAEMAQIVKEDLSFRREEISVEQARLLFADNPYKKEWLDAIEQRGEKVSVYYTGEDFVDLCSGPHIDSTGQIGAFKLLNIAGAYWHGDEKNKMLTRIYGTAFPSQVEIEAYLSNLEEAKRRDHRRLGKELELFTFSNEVGSGLTMWLPNGATIRREIENYMVREQIKMGYKHVYSPHIGQKSLWEKSGHWDLYREKMYSPMDVDGTEYLVKPMTCPMHIQSFQFKPHSYRELPIRIAEIASVYRYEQSGELSGLLRVRAFTQDDAHIFCTQEQAVDEFLSVFRFIQKLYATFGFSDYRVRLGVRSKKEKYLGSDELWEKAEAKAIEALQELGSKYVVSEGDAAFYGPKADFLIKDALGREWQCGTVQIDFMLPERFGLKYVDQDGQEKTPVMVHRAPLGSLERFLAILIENYGGAFPLWLSPIQAVVIPISQDQSDYAASITASLMEQGIRVENWNEAESMQNRIRKAEQHKIPYMLIVGRKEVADQTVSVRSRQNRGMNVMPLADLLSELQTKIADHSLE
jgi:threonyl-tRNA synthetase